MQQEISTFENFEASKGSKTNMKKFYWPLKSEGKYNWVIMYKMFILFHTTVILAFNVGRIAFEEKPWLYVVYIEFYLNLVFLLEVVRQFT